MGLAALWVNLTKMTYGASAWGADAPRRRGAAFTFIAASMVSSINAKRSLAMGGMDLLTEHRIASCVIH
jgi:hypothetical protein